MPVTYIAFQLNTPLVSSGHKTPLHVLLQVLALLTSLSTLKRLHWLPIDARIKFKIATLYRPIKLYTPAILHILPACFIGTIHVSLRSASANVLSVTRSNLSFGSRAFRAAASTVWNSLPPHVRSCTTLTTFRKHLKSHLFQSSFPTA